MAEFTENELILMYELVLREKVQINKELESDLRRNVFKILRPGVFRKLGRLNDILLKLNLLGKELQEKEKQDV